MKKVVKKPKTITKKNTKAVMPPPLDIGLPKSGLVSGRKAMDIVPKNRTMPSSSGKPVIVSHRTIVKDPMAPPELTDTPAVEKPRKTLKKTTKTVIEPLHNKLPSEGSDSEKPSEGTVKEPKNEIITTPKSDGNDSDLPQPKQSSGREELEISKTDAENERQVNTLSTNDEVAEDIKKSIEPKPEDLERERTERRAEAAEVLIESRKYFLPINAVKKRRSIHLAWFLLLILGSLVAVVVLLDAGILTFVSAPTDFI
jgi:hypothetical protein